MPNSTQAQSAWVFYWNSRVVHCFMDEAEFSLCGRWRRTSFVDEARPVDEDPCELCDKESRLVTAE